jgi:hypothetical protein
VGLVLACNLFDEMLAVALAVLADCSLSDCTGVVADRDDALVGITYPEGEVPPPWMIFDNELALAIEVLLEDADELFLGVAPDADSTLDLGT